MLTFDAETGVLRDARSGLVFADGPVRYAVAGFQAGGRAFADTELERDSCRVAGRSARMEGRFPRAGLKLVHCVEPQGDDLAESITIENTGPTPVVVSRLEIGLLAKLQSRAPWRLVAIPFRKQLDGSLHDYRGGALARRAFRNAVYPDPIRTGSSLTEDCVLRSEAWAWGPDPDGAGAVGSGGSQGGLVVMKYNNDAIELSVAAVEEQVEGPALRFGGVGLHLYGEPSPATRLEPGQWVKLGQTIYGLYHGGLDQAFYRYRRFLEERGHGFPAEYDPPINWNELYDVGWFHSDPVKLAACYTRPALLQEAAKARDCGCDLLYLDPGWGRFEGSTLWDEARLGSVASLVATLKQQYGLRLGFRSVLRCYREPTEGGWPPNSLVERRGDTIRGKSIHWLWELCLCHRPMWEEKVRRIVAIARQGVSFIMIDEFDWRGPCEATDHTHARPTTALDHARAVFDLCREVRRQCPGVIIEAHDPIWPWLTARYVPTYFRQGFGPGGDFDENWGFEYMWDCLNDLKTGKALALYYYNLACHIPLYLHITMAADNDDCLFFWWAASTVRHLGIGGRDGHPSVNPAHLPAWDKARRFEAYRRAVARYRQLKPWFVRGVFHGLREDAHLHTLPGTDGTPGGVLVLFNLTDQSGERTVSIPAELLGGTQLPVTGATGTWSADTLTVHAELGAMTPAVVLIGKAALDATGIVQTKEPLP